MTRRVYESPLSSASLAIPPGGIETSATITDDRSGKKLGVIQNTAVVNADTEYTYALPSEARGFSARLLLGKLSLRFQATGDYRTIFPGGSYDLERLSPDAPPLILYFKSSIAADTFQVETWS